MEVRLVPNPLRAGVGRSPARENRRAFLPQHARLLPQVEDANTLGFLVYAPLHDHESVQLHARHDGVLAITLFVGDPQGERGPVSITEVVPAAGTGGVGDMRTTILDDGQGYDESSARALLDALFAGINAPPGTIGLRSTHSFITPEGWDTVYTAVLNDVQRPAVGVLSTRVETDWLAVDTEIRYVLEEGDVLSVVGSGPIGQVFFVPRTETLLADASEAEVGRFADVQRRYAEEAVREAKMTKYGGAFTYQYRDHQRARRREGDDGRYRPLRDPAAVPGDR